MQSTTETRQDTRSGVLPRGLSDSLWSSELTFICRNRCATGNGSRFEGPRRWRFCGTSHASCCLKILYRILIFEVYAVIAQMLAPLG